MHVDGIGTEEDDIVRDHTRDEVIDRQDKIAVDMAGFADAHGGTGAHERGFFAAGHVFVEEVHEFLDLAAALLLGGREVFGIGGIDPMDARAIHDPLVLFNASPDVDALAGQVPFAGRLGLGHPPVQAAVAHAVYAAEFGQMGDHLGHQGVGVHVVHAEEERGGLDASVFRIAEYAGCSGPIGHGSVTGGINHHIGPGGFEPGGCQQDGAADPFALHDGPDEVRMIEHLDAGFLAEVVVHDFQEFGVERGAMVVSFADPGGKFRSLADAGGVQGAADGHQPVHHLLKEAPDDHPFAFGIVAGHKRTHQTFGAHAAQAVATVNQQGPDALTGSRYGGAHTRGATSHHQQLAAVRFFCIDPGVRKQRIAGGAASQQGSPGGGGGQQAGGLQEFSSVHRIYLEV